MKNLFTALFALLLLGSCTAEPIEGYENSNPNPQLQTPDSDGIYMEEIDKDKVQRPGSQGDS